MPGNLFRATSNARRVMLAVALALVSLILSAGTTRYSYDEANRLQSLDLGEGRRIIYSYDVAGNLTGRAMSLPCFNWATFMGHVAQWPQESSSVLQLVQDVTCPEPTTPSSPMLASEDDHQDAHP